MRRLIGIFFLLSAVQGLRSQEVVTALQFNPVIQERIQQAARLKEDLPAADTFPVSLPFRDDFSGNDIFPSPDRWADRYAFRNDDIGVFPVNIGVMTLDAINDSGSFYPHAVPGPATFIADYLTSRKIRLDSLLLPVPTVLQPSDSVYLSFFFQPQGRAMAPQKNDTLVLEFLVRPSRDTLILGDTVRLPDEWRQMWNSNGMPLDTFYQRNNRWFMQVMVPVTDPVFFRRNFQFRFFNYASLASPNLPSWQSNSSYWNLDNIYLNKGRSLNDTVIPEVRFIYRPPSLLKRYQSMPYPQYCDDPTNELRDTLDVFITNRSPQPQMTSYGYTVSDPSGTFSRSYNGGSYNIQPWFVSPYVTYQKFAHPELPFLIPISQADSAVFRMRHYLQAPGAGYTDTIEAYQKFFNYYAYDDGTPEASYGLSRKGAMMAVRFSLNRSPDTLRAVHFYFNRTLSNSSQQNFYLCIWNDNAGKPGQIIFTDTVLPRYSDTLNKFVTYHLQPALPVTGTFYAGTIQTTDDNLSIGYDRYNNSQNDILYNVTGTWIESAYSGSLMIRPVIGKPIPLGVEDPGYEKPVVRVAPNPCTDGLLRIRITGQRSGEPTPASVRIYDPAGRPLGEWPFEPAPDIRHLSPGLYLAEVRTASGSRLATVKFVVGR